tara:strand:+ start:12310 stop:12516 length:207 start_codon:yes stop_codon:yes gene_type:complete
MNGPSDKMIPSTTTLNEDQYKVLVEYSIPSREERLAKLKVGDIEESLWLMDELSHLREMKEYNDTQRT